MKSYRYIPMTLALGGLLGACGGDDPETNTDQRPIQCRSADYVAFDEANYTNQQLRVQAYVDMIALMKAAESADPFDPALAATNFAEAQRLYETTASLRDKVQGRTDDHFDDKPVVGADIDAKIMSSLADGAAAQTALEAKLARQWVDKQLIHFFYLSVVHEMYLGKRDKWDEAFGYLGVGIDNAESSAKALMAVARSRDSNNNTVLAEDIFVGLIDGACALTEALDAAGTEEVDFQTVPELKAVVDRVDADMIKVLAYSAGHEAFDMIDLQKDLTDQATRDSMYIKLAELDPYFQPVERLMMRAGGESQTRAEAIRADIDAAWAAQDEDWMGTFDAQGVIDKLEAEFGIDVKG